MFSNSRYGLALFTLVVMLTSMRIVTRAQTGGAGQNINVVTGTGTFTNDLDLYRKNEPVIAISSANPSHMLVAYNDARTVDAVDDSGTGPQSPGQGLFAKVVDFFRAPWRRDRDSKGEWEVEGPAAANQAWIGLSLTNNGGKNWFSGLHPGRYVSIPTDLDPGWSDALLLNSFDAANDPVLTTTPPHVSVQGPVGDQFFLAGIAFNLPTPTTPGQGVGFISRFTDRNNTENAQSVHYDGTKVLLKSADFTTPTAMNFFVDKPSIAAGPNGHVYAAFVVFDQNDPNKLSSKILFFSSANYGDSWSPPVVVSQPLTRNQAPWIVVDNNDERIVYIGWRVFANPLFPNLTNAVVGRRSFDGGATFSPSVPYPVALLLKAFDQRQGDLRALTPPSPRSAAYPSAAMDGNGAIHVLMQEYVYPFNYPTTSLRGLPLAPSALPSIGVPRITVTTSFNQGVTWTIRKAVDLGSATAPAGTQFMPTIAAVGEPGPPCSGKAGPRSRVIAMFYDARPSGVGVVAGVDQGILAGGDKQFDVRIAQASACSANAVTGLSFSPSEQMSHYQRSSTAPYPIVPIPVQPSAFTPPYAAVNRGYTMSCKGNCSFSGDYISTVARVPYVKTASGAFKPTTAVMSDADRDKLPAPVVQGVWTDTRDAVLPMVGSLRTVPVGASPTIDVLPWDVYNVNVADPNGFALCSNLGTRHQSVYSSEYTPGGLFASAPVTFRASTIPRSYPLHVENRAPFKKTFRLTIDPFATASFDFRSFDTTITPAVPLARQTSVVIDSISSVTGSVVVGPGVNTPIPITVEETDSTGAVIAPPAGAKTTVTLNTTGTDTSTTETAVPAILQDPIVTKPLGVVPSSGIPRSLLGSPTPFSPNPFSPNPFSPNPFSPNPFSPNPFSPNPFSPNPFSPNVPPDAVVYDVTDVSYVITNEGQQTAAFNSVIERVQNTSGVHVFQVLLNRAVPVSTVSYDNVAQLNCRAVDSALAVPISTIAVPFSPNPFSPNPFSPNPFSPNPFSPNPFSPNYAPLFSNSTFYVAPKGSTSGAVARLDDGGKLSGRGPQQLARRAGDARVRNASLIPSTPGAYIGEPVNDVMVLTLRDLLLSPPCTPTSNTSCGRPISPADVTVSVRAEVPNVNANGQFDPGGPSVTSTQPLIVANTASCGNGPVSTFDVNTGVAVASFIPSGAAANCNNGRGVEVSGNNVYYTELANGFGATDAIHVAPFNGGAGGADIATIPSPRPGTGIQDLDFSRGSLYALTGYPSNPLQVFRFNFATQAWSSPIAISGPASPDSDGFTVLPNGNFLINNGDTSCTYNQYDPTGQVISGTTIVIAPIPPADPAFPGGACTGVDTDGTSLYFMTNFNRIIRTDLAGVFISSTFIGSHDFEDISFTVRTVASAPPTTPVIGAAAASAAEIAGDGDSPGKQPNQSR